MEEPQSSSHSKNYRHSLGILQQFLPWDDSQRHKVFVGLPLFYVGLASVFINILSLALPIALIQVYDRIIPYNSYETLAALGLMVFVALIFELILKMARSYLLEWSGAVFEHRAFYKAMDHLLQVDPAAIDKKGVGYVMQYLEKIPKLREFYAYQPAFMMVIDLPFVFFYLGLMWYLGGWIILPPIILISFFLLFVWKEIGDLYLINYEYESTEKKRNNFLIEILKGLHTIKSFGAEKLFLRRYDRLIKVFCTYAFEQSIRHGGIFNKTMALSQLTNIAVTTVGAYLFMQGHFGLGSFSACILLGYRLIYPLQRSVTFLQKLNSIYTYQGNVENVLELPLMSHKNIIIAQPQGDIVLDDIIVQFPHANEPLFHKLSVKIPPKTCISISGPLHSGSTTLINVICGIVKPQSGEVLVDGVAPYDISREQFSQVIGCIATYGEIFNGTILENLTYFRTFDEDLALHYSKSLGIDHLIKQLPMGYETMLYDSSADPISPGIKQRIAIARTLAANAKIILFDNADSSLDNEGADYLIKTLKELKGTKTILILSNNPDIMHLADEHYALINKKIEKNSSRPSPGDHL